MMESDRLLLAILIDADNVPAKYAKALLEEIASLGEASIRRIYGDFSNGLPQGWTREVLADLAIVAHQQFAFTKGKNASDIALVIDAMDILHGGHVDGIVLVSSDSDFTRLASRVREQGLQIIGMGESKTPNSFQNACQRFISLENLIDEEETGEGLDQPSIEKQPASKAVPMIRTAMKALVEPGEWVALSPLGLQINRANSGFDYRSYGCKSLAELLEKSGGFMVDRTSDPMRARFKKSGEKGTAATK